MKKIAYTHPPTAYSSQLTRNAHTCGIQNVQVCKIQNCKFQVWHSLSKCLQFRQHAKKRPGYSFQRAKGKAHLIYKFAKFKIVNFKFDTHYQNAYNRQHTSKKSQLLWHAFKMWHNMHWRSHYIPCHYNTKPHPSIYGLSKKYWASYFRVHAFSPLHLPLPQMTVFSYRYLHLGLTATAFSPHRRNKTST